MRGQSTVALMLLVSVSCAQPVQTHGQMAGDPTSDTVSVWTRASGPATASAIYSTNQLLFGATETPPVAVTAATDFTVRFDLTGLLPGTRYYYSFRLRDPANPGSQTIGSLGRFRTPATPATLDDLTVTFAADININVAYDLFASMEAQSPDLGLLLGDFPYADSSPAATTLAAYRSKHQLSRDESLLQSFMSSCATASTWDDHEIKNNWDAATDPNRVALGRAVWKEYFPVRPNGDAIYRQVRLGRGAEFFILDTRTYRGTNADADLPGRTLLGVQQLQWLQTALLASDALFKFVVTSVPLRYGTTNKDHWQGYMRERQQLFSWIASQRIANVIFLAGDQHWSSIHHHREGVKEFQACPIATTVRTPPAEPEPEVVAIFPVRSYGVLRIRPSLSPPEVDIEIHDSVGLISTTTLTAQDPGALRIALDHPDAGFVLQGPHRFRNQGALTELPYAPAGTYTATFTPPISGLAAPAPWSLPLVPGGFLSAATSFGVGDDPAHPTLFLADFDAPDLSAWTFVDEGTTSAPSAWFQDDFQLVQSSNIYGGSTAATNLTRPGTYAAVGDPAWTDVTFTFRMKTQDDDGVGAMFRLAPNGSFYRFSMDQQRAYQRLSRTVGGVTTVLDEVAVAYTSDHWYDVTIKAIGPNLSVALDGVTVLTATDATIPAGRIALYSWGSQVVWFDRVRVLQGDAPPYVPGSLFCDDFSSGTLAGWTVVDQGTISAPSAWSAANGVALQSSNIHGGSLVGTDPEKPGTFLHTGPATWSDIVLSARMSNPDNDAIGLMFRIVDNDNYYRFSMDRERSYRRLTKTVSGVTTILVEDAVPFTSGVWYDVVVRAEGAELEVFVDGTSILAASDSTFAAGRVGLYVWGSTGAMFDDVCVTTPGPAPLSFVVHGSTLDFDLDVFASAWPGRDYLLALSLGTSPGIPLSVLNPADPRVVPLNPDALFLLSLMAPMPMFSGFSGTLDGAGRGTGTILLPPGTSVSGLSLYASGILLDAAAPSGVGAVLPGVRLTLP